MWPLGGRIAIERAVFGGKYGNLLVAELIQCAAAW
jgi:hypothetical protein